MDSLRWYSQLAWSRAHAVRTVNKEAIPPGAGIYAFSSDTRALSLANVLYIGKADGAVQTLRTRVGSYLRRFSSYPAGTPTKHAGKEALARYCFERQGQLYVRWAGIVVARDVEGSLIAAFDPKFNSKDEHRYGIADEELIPEGMLYTWP